MNEKQEFLISLLPSDKERIELAMIMSESIDPEILSTIVATVDLVIDCMKKKAGLYVASLDNDNPSEN